MTRGGFEAYLNEGFAHIEVVSAKDVVNDNATTALLSLLERDTP